MPLKIFNSDFLSSLYRELKDDELDDAGKDESFDCEFSDDDLSDFEGGLSPLSPLSPRSPCLSPRFAAVGIGEMSALAGMFFPAKERFRLEPFGRGVSGEVFKFLFDGKPVTHCGKEVLVKLIRLDAESSEECDKEVIEHELAMAVKVGLSPKRAKVYEPERHSFFFFMYKMPGMELSDFLSKRDVTLKSSLPKLVPIELAIIFLNLLNGVVSLQSLGVVHGDIKPENILICEDTLSLSFIDFGHAELLKTDETYKDSNQFGSPYYSRFIAEGATSRRVGFFTDNYSLSMVFLSMLNGIKLSEERGYVPPGGYVTGLSAKLREDLIGLCLKMGGESEDEFSSAAKYLVELKKILMGSIASIVAASSSLEKSRLDFLVKQFKQLLDIESRASTEKFGEGVSVRALGWRLV